MSFLSLQTPTRERQLPGQPSRWIAAAQVGRTRCERQPVRTADGGRAVQLPAARDGPRGAGRTARADTQVATHLAVARAGPQVATHSSVAHADSYTYIWRVLTLWCVRLAAV